MAETAKKTEEEKKTVYVCVTKCYAAGLVYNVGDTAEGVDLSDNPNFTIQK